MAEINHDNLHRTAKYFMDSGRASTADAAVELLRGFSIVVKIDLVAAKSPLGQSALLTLVNLARRTFLGGVEVVGPMDVPTIGMLAPQAQLGLAVKALGGCIVDEPTARKPTILIGNEPFYGPGAPAWRLHWTGWSGGVVPAGWGDFTLDPKAMPLAPVVAAAIAVSEAFSYFAGDHPLAGRRATGLSLWNLSGDWLNVGDEPQVALLPSRLWILGLGNLGQAYAWALACLPYPLGHGAELTLQDFDVVGPSNDSTSVLSTLDAVGQKKGRMIAEWLEPRGFKATIEERRFNSATRWSTDDPEVLLCGVDSGLVRSQLDGACFPLVVEAGLGAGPNSFRSIGVHTLPATRPSTDIWRATDSADSIDFENTAAYSALKAEGMDDCGLAQLASRTVGVPFVGMIAATLVVSELLRRLHGGQAAEVVALSTLCPEEIEYVPIDAPLFRYGHVDAASAEIEPKE